MIVKNYKKQNKFKNLLKKLQKRNHQNKGRNNQGHITIRHKGGGHKKLYRLIDFSRKKYNITGTVVKIEYDPYRSANIALIKYSDGDYRYILSPENLKLENKLVSFTKSSLTSSLILGNSCPLNLIPIGTKIHNIELIPGKGGQLVRAAGVYANILGKEDGYVSIKLPSKEIRIIKENCLATIGQVSNVANYLKNLKKAGAKRWRGIRPTVRGSAMNAIDHPHGGGEGKSPIGKKFPSTPWGKPTLGFRTRKKKKSDFFITKKRYVK